MDHLIVAPWLNHPDEARPLSSEDPRYPAFEEWAEARHALNGPELMLWVNGLMQLPRGTRKELSYNGAVQSEPGEAVHWQCSRYGRGYRDACNQTYARALMSALASVARRPWSVDLPYNREKLGDIVEIGLAMAWEDPSEENESFRRRLERIVRAVEHLYTMAPSLWHLGDGQWVDEIDLLWLTRHERPTASPTRPSTEHGRSPRSRATPSLATPPISKLAEPPSAPPSKPAIKLMPRAKSRSSHSTFKPMAVPPSKRAEPPSAPPSKTATKPTPSAKATPPWRKNAKILRRLGVKTAKILRRLGGATCREFMRADAKL